METNEKKEDMHSDKKPAEQKGRGIGLSFGAKPQEHPRAKKTGFDAVFSSVNENINSMVRSVRILEERYSNLRKKTQVTDQNMLSDFKKITTEIKLLSSDVSEIRKQLVDINEKTGLLAEQMKSSVRKEDLDVLDKYLNLWEPMGYVTYKEAVDIINQSKKSSIKQGIIEKNKVK